MAGNRALGSQMETLISNLGGSPAEHPVHSKYATAEQMDRLIETLGEGGIAEAVSDWLDDHPEATTTVEDGAITKAKLGSELLGEIEGDTASIASAFSTSANYSVGDYVMYENALYRFTSAHSAGAWSDDDVESATVGAEISVVKSATDSNSHLLTNETVTWVSDWGMSKSLFKVSSGNLVSDSWKSGYRVASNYTSPVYLLSGTKIVLPNDRRIAVIYSADNSSGSWNDLGWKTASYTLVNNGYYAFIISSPSDDVAVTTAAAFCTDVRVFNPGDGSTVTEQLETIEDRIYPFTDWHDNVSFGTITVNENGWATSSYKSGARIRINPSQPIVLKKGSRIVIPYGYAINISYRISGVYYWTDWRYSDYICDYDAEYVFTYRKDDTDFPSGTTAKQVAATIKIIRAEDNSINNLLTDYTGIVPAETRKIKSIARIGYNIGDHDTPPENSIAGFEMAYEYGFRYMLADVRWTSDHVPVALHETSINNVARNSDGTSISGTINIADITLETADTYDFGIKKGSRYAGTKIMRIADFVKWCIKHGCKIILELKNDNNNVSTDNLNALFAILDKYNVGNNCIFCLDIGETSQTAVHTKYPKATLFTGCSQGTNVAYAFAHAGTLKDDNEVYVYVYANLDFSYQITAEMVAAAVTNGVGIGLTECMYGDWVTTFLNNEYNLACDWLAIRGAPFDDYMRKINSMPST